jgi:adenine-specific DNA-methyltransferase
METRSKYTPLEIDEYLLGVEKNTAYYFIYDPQKPTTLDLDFLTQIREKQDEYIVYADSCTISETDLNQWRITFKKIPRDISKI